MALSPEATYKGRLISNMDRDELLELIEAQIIEFRKLSDYVNWAEWRNSREVIDSLEI